MESSCSRRWWGDHWAGWGPSWRCHTAHCAPPSRSPSQPPPSGRRNSQSLFFWFHPQSFLYQPTSFLQVPLCIGLSTRKLLTFNTGLAFYCQVPCVNQYLKHFSCRVSLWSPDEVVRVLQEVLEGVEGDFLCGHGQEGGVGGGEVLKQEHASKYDQAEDNSAWCIDGGIFLALYKYVDQFLDFVFDMYLRSKPVAIELRRAQKCSKSISKSLARQARRTWVLYSWHGGRRGRWRGTQTRPTRRSKWSHWRKKRTLQDLFREI